MSLRSLHRVGGVGLAVVTLTLALALVGVWWLASRRPRSVVILVDANELAQQPDLPVYFDDMSRCDRAARHQGGCDTLEGYLGAVVPPARLPPAAVAVLHAHVAQAQALLVRAGCVQGLVAPSWRIAVLEDRAEDGWPHTHGAIVCLPLHMVLRPGPESVKTLVHERVHVFQRSADAAALVAEVVQGDWGMTPMPRADVCRRVGVTDRVRSNPDLDDNVYTLGDDPCVVRLTVFESEASAARGGLRAATSVAFDICRSPGPIHHPLEKGHAPRRPSDFEHPFEAMAYLVADAVVCGGHDASCGGLSHPAVLRSPARPPKGVSKKTLRTTPTHTVTHHPH